MKSLGRFLLTRFLLIYFLLVLLGIVALAWSRVADAQTPCPTGAVPSDAARVCWTNPTQNTNGAAIEATGPTSLVTTEIRRAVCTSSGGMGTTVETISVPATIGVALFSGLPPAAHCFQARVRNELGQWSAWTLPASKTTTAPAPPKPRQPNLTVA